MAARHTGRGANGALADFGNFPFEGLVLDGVNGHVRRLPKLDIDDIRLIHVHLRRDDAEVGNLK